MTENGITAEERRCLQLWFRQAIAQVETEELSSRLIRRDGLDETDGNHRAFVSRRRSRRSQATHGRDSVLK
jgi:hypothetical protein